MKRFSSLLIAIFLFLTCSLVFSRTGAFYNNNANSVQQDSPITLTQIQALLKNRTPDSAVAIEIRRRGIDFTPSAPILEQLRKLGAGGKTLKALEETNATTQRPQSQQSKFVILVADFKSLDDKNYGVTESLIERLRDATEEYPDTEIKALNSAITAQQGDAAALALAKEHGANMVLWGWYAKNRESLMLNLHCQLLHESPNLILSKDKQTLIVPASELESFSIQVRVAEEMAYLSLFIVGVARFEADDYEGAIVRLTKAINLASVPTSMVNPANTHLYRALSYFVKQFRSGGSELTNALADLNQALVLDPGKSEAYALRGFFLTLKDEMQKALADFSKSIELDAENAFSYAMRGWVHKELGENERAKSDFHQALKLTEQPVDDAKNQFIRGYAYLLNDEYDQAIAAFDQLAKINRDALPQVYVLRAAINGLRKNYDASILDLSKAINLQPDQAWFYAVRAAAYEEKEDYDTAIADYSRAIKLEPRNTNFLTARGSSYHSKGETSNALADYDRAININPKDPHIYSARAQVYVKTKEYERAEADLNKAVALSPEDENVYQSRARFYEERGNYDRALSDYNEIIKRNPNDGSNFYNRGHLYFQKGEFDLAIQDYDKGIELDPEDSFFLVFRADAYAAKGDDKKAFADYAKAIELAPNDSFRYFSRARFYENKGDYERAIADYDQAKKVKPDDEVVQYFRRGAIHKIILRGLEAEKKGDFESALKDYNRAIELEGANALAYYIRGELYKGKGELDRAIQDYNEAIRLEPKADSYYFARGEAYEKKGLIEQATRDFRKVLELTKDDALRQRAQEELRKLEPKL